MNNFFYPIIRKIHTMGTHLDQRWGVFYMIIPLSISMFRLIENTFASIHLFMTLATWPLEGIANSCQGAPWINLTFNTSTHASP